MFRRPPLIHFALFAFGLSACVGQPSAPSEQNVATQTADAEDLVPLCPPSASRFHCMAYVHASARGQFAPQAKPSGLGADDLKAAYNLDTSLDPGVTIAIVDAYGYKKAESDLQVYRTQFGLGPCTIASGCLTIVNQDGKTSPLPPEGTGMDAGWMGETALDLDMASAACPKCKILLVQANNPNDDGLMIAQETAAKLGAAVISDSWGGGEDDMNKGIDQEHYFMLSTAATVFVASGDYGYNNGGLPAGMGQGPDYPSTSAYVIGVGGTTLTKSAGTPRGWTEAGWKSAGSSCSISIPKPSWQTPDTKCTMRAASDVSAAASNIAVYGPTFFGGSGWQPVAGTSASSPFVASVFALTGHGFSSPSFPYEHPEAFNDITTGSNGSCGAPLCKAGTGWDGLTGWGSPKGDVLAGAPPPPPPPHDMAGPPGSDMATPTPTHDMAMPPTPTHDMATTPPTNDMATGPNPTPPDLATAPDLAHGGGNPPGGCGCTVGGMPTSGAGGLAFALVLVGALVLLRRRYV